MQSRQKKSLKANNRPTQTPQRNNSANTNPKILQRETQNPNRKPIQPNRKRNLHNKPKSRTSQNPQTNLSYKNLTTKSQNLKAKPEKQTN